MKSKSFFCAALILAALLPLRAQTGTAVFAPFVSRLEGELKNNLLRLSWTDSPDVKGPVYIFRSALPFDGPNPPPLGTPVEIPYGTGSFVDEIESGVTLYYFAAASDESGRRYDLPIPFTNTINVGNAPASSGLPAAAPPAEKVPERTALPGDTEISALEAAGREDGVTIRFSGGTTKTATLYRSTRPISQTQDLLGAVIVRAGISSPFTDYPVPGIPYYYAVIAEEDLLRGTVKITPGSNATTAAAAAGGNGSGQASPGRDIRTMPLPGIAVEAALPGMAAYTETPAEAELSGEAAKALEKIPPRGETVRVLKKPRVFARDMENSPAGGEEYALGEVIKGSFAAKNWEAAREELIRFLALPRSPETSARARFYLGQCCYFLRLPREGLFEFLSIRERYPGESAEWIQASLNLLKE